MVSRCAVVARLQRCRRRVRHQRPACRDPRPRNDYDILFSLGTLLIILGVFLTGWAARRQHLK
jgi:hypothetical protein